ncbi:Cytosine-specific methyltransferase HphIA-like protein [Cladobotryum mycophilum]|uniref:DNA (cytosine-5-)-methyltransferase n=1 Tax=Cladobotryum mycophilum TaxID=491253 RepID=A0ABR0T2X6_9HYPO
MPLSQTTEDEVQFLTSRNPTTTRSSSTESSRTIGRGEREGPFGLFDNEAIDLTTYESEVVIPDSLQDGEFPLESIRQASGATLRRGDFIQVRPFQLGAYEIEFVQIQMLAQGQEGTHKIRGIPFARTRRLLGKLPRKLNEVVMILHIQRFGNVTAEPHLVDVPLRSIVKKRTLIITNATYKDRSYDTWSIYRHVRGKDRRRLIVESKGHLVCRWKFKIYLSFKGHKLKPDETLIERIHWEEAPDPRYRMSEEAICNQWRGGRIKGGSWCPSGLFDESVIDLEESSQSPSFRKRRSAGQKYTMFDSFSGAGGVSRGAQSAGFHIQGAVDKSPEVWETYKLNFSNAELFEMSVDEFIRTTVGRGMRADVLHLSPPCQYFSPAHTRAAAHDETNIYALLSCHQLIEKLRPRIITLEQTFGIVHDQHDQYLTALIGDFTQQGYSIRWKIVRLCTWGLAQDRKRLIMIAAGPGERLPPFPDPTHSENGGGGLKPFTTIRQAISGLRHGHYWHNIDSTKHYEPLKPPLNADQLAGTITTGGSDAYYYPDGTRDFTVREYACLQGFPRSHRFVGNKTSVKRQIGNAFAPNTVRVLYKHLEDWLLKEDGMVRYQPSVENLTIVDGDDSDASSPWSSSSGAASLPEVDDEFEAARPERNRIRDILNFVDLT